MLLLLAIECLCLPVFGIFYNVHWTAQPGWLALILVLGTWGIVVIGTMFSALTVNLRLRELMLPTLVYPLLVPTLLPAIEMTSVVIGGQPLAGDMLQGIRLLVAFDVIFTALGLALVETVLVG
jgi:heme exporter protein B